MGYRWLYKLYSTTLFKRMNYIHPKVTFSSLPDESVQDGVFSVEKDEDIGVTAFLSNHNGFSGILRHLYSDFLVNEIGSEKEIVRLTNLGHCDKLIPRFFQMTKLFSKEVANFLIQVIEGKPFDETEINVAKLEVRSVEELCQTLRKLVHNLDVYKKKTDLGDVIVLTPRTEKENFYTNFVMLKENLPSVETLQLIARKLKIRPGDVSVAGWKDKRSISCQRVSVKNVKAEKLLALNTTLRGIKLGSIYYDNKPLRFGNNYGNHFTILLREIDSEESVFHNSLENFTNRGFINYYGLQRFGRTELPTLSVGLKMFARDWETVTEMILKPTKHKVAEDVLKSRQVWWATRDPQKALSFLHFHTNREGLLLKGLSETKSNYEQALEWIPLSSTRFYLYSYCSYVWNKIVSRRINEFGKNPILGDLVMPKGTIKVTPENENQIKVVDQKMLERGHVNLYDVILPLPGTRMKLPQNILADWYHEILEKDGLNMSSFQSENKRYSVTASYRFILSKPENVSWSVLRYDNPDEVLLHDDYTKMLGLNVTRDNFGNRSALKLEFSLLTSCYATAALREITQRCITGMS